MWSLAFFALCLSSIYANTIPSSRVLITYDDLESNALDSQVDPIPNPYNQLDFNRFQARANGVSVLRSVSGNNTAASNVLNDILAGQTPNITSDYTGSPVSSFDLVSTYVGCALPTELSVGVPQKCTIQFKGQTKSGKTASALCNYDAKQRQVEFCDFKGQLNGLRYVTVLPTDTETLNATTVEYLDNTEVVRHYY